ncbi:MAG: Ig-like domain-containing protein, partial [Planctomycetota bacterium]|nr:Ig-like domain-containing protein [Planctomycetota bacterium]
DDGNDNLLLIHADRNLVEGCSITKARHAIWCIRAGNFNVLRNNYFSNPSQKIGELYDAAADPPVAFDATKHNVLEGNEFDFTPSSGNSSPYAGIQFAGQETVVRFNRFHDTTGPAIDLTLYSSEAMYDTHNRIYNNVFYSTRFAGIHVTWPTDGTLFDNIIKNNILSHSTFVANDTRWSWYTTILAGKPVQFLAGRLDGFVFENNNVFSPQGDDRYLVTYGDRTSSSNPPPQTVSWWNSNYPVLFKGNIQNDPMYVDGAQHDFHLKAGSPMIDAGAFLTRAVGSGSGAVLPVEDTRYFFDGFGMTDENGQPALGDLIQLEGQAQTARLLAIDYTANTLRLDRPVTWTAGQGVGLRYYGTKPDIGAYEYASSANHPPVAVNDTYGVPPNSNGNVLNVLANDTDPDPGDVLTSTDVTTPLHGTVEIQAGSTALRYTPVSGYGGTDSFTYTISDGNGGTATATVSIAVTANPPKVTAVTLNDRTGRSVSAIEPSGIGVQTVTVKFSKPVTFDATAVVAEAVSFVGGVEAITDIFVPRTLTGSGTDTMTLEFDSASIVDTGSR